MKCNRCHTRVERCGQCLGSGDALLGHCGYCRGSGWVCPEHGEHWF